VLLRYGTLVTVLKTLIFSHRRRRPSTQLFTYLLAHTNSVPRPNWFTFA